MLGYEDDVALKEEVYQANTPPHIFRGCKFVSPVPPFIVHFAWRYEGKRSLRVGCCG